MGAKSCEPRATMHCIPKPMEPLQGFFQKKKKIADSGFGQKMKRLGLLCGERIEGVRSESRKAS